jgi:hypothetical protein
VPVRPWLKILSFRQTKSSAWLSGAALFFKGTLIFSKWICLSYSCAPYLPLFENKDAMKTTLLCLIVTLNSNSVVAQSNGPGKPVRSEAQETVLSTFFRQLGNDSVNIQYFYSTLFFGPAFFQQMGDDKIIASLGTPVNIQTSSGKMKSRVFKDSQIAKLFSSPIFVAVLKTFVGGTARMANQKERDVYYSLISYEIEGKAVTVFDNGKHVLLFDFVDDQVVHIDLISAYSKN